MGANSTSYKQYGNPVLSTFCGFTVQPYWLFITELLFLQLLQRLNSLIESACKKKKKQIYIALEITLIGPKRTGASPPKYSILDFILSLISVGHFIYACYAQTGCLSSVNSSSWNCYNAFGYRLYNYVLPSVIAVLVDSIIQIINTYREYKDNPEKATSKKFRNFKWFLLGTTIVLNTLVCLAFIPFLVTNVVPMLIAYCWFLLPILAGLILVYAIFITSMVNALRKCEGCGCVYCFKFFAAHCIVGCQVFGCLIMTMAFNYSQYSFYGADYKAVIAYEAQSRDTVDWYNALTNSSQLVVHNILAI